MKIFKIIITFIFVFYANHIIAEKSKLNITYVTIEQSTEPIEINDESSKNKGIITDVVVKIFSKEEYRFEYQILPALRYRNEIMSFTHNKPNSIKHFVSFGAKKWYPKDWNLIYSNEPLITLERSLMVSAQKNLKYTKLSDLFGKTIVIIRGFDYPELEKYINNNKGPIKELRVNSGYQAIDIVNKKDRDEIAFVDFKLRAQYQIKKKNIPLSNFNFYDLSDILKPTPIYLIFSNDFSKSELNHINEKISILIKSNEIEKILKKYQ